MALDYNMAMNKFITENVFRPTSKPELLQLYQE